MFYPEWYEDRLSMCQECGGVIDGDPNAGEVGQPGEIDHKLLCPACFEKHPEAKTRLTPVAAELATVCEHGVSRQIGDCPKCNPPHKAPIR